MGVKEPTPPPPAKLKRVRLGEGARNVSNFPETPIDLKCEQCGHRMPVQYKRVATACQIEGHTINGVIYPRCQTCRWLTVAEDAPADGRLAHCSNPSIAVHIGITGGEPEQVRLYPNLDVGCVHHRSQPRPGEAEG